PRRLRQFACRAIRVRIVESSLRARQCSGHAQHRAHLEETMKKLIHSAVATFALTACLGTTSCIGPNNLYNGIASWNSRLAESKFVNELVFLGLYIIPVYPLALFGDLILFNSVEFWSGKNWIKKPEEFKPQETSSAK